MASAPGNSGNNSLLNQAKSVANAATAGPISELAKQIATNNQSNQTGQNTDFGYYMQLAQAAKDAVGQQQQIGAGLNSTLAGIGQNTQAQIGQFGQQAQGGALGRMNALGLGGDSAGQLAAETARQQGIGALNAQTFQDAGANQSANYAQNAANMRGVVGLAGTEQIGNLARAGQLANEPLNAKIASLQDKRGALTETALGQLQKNQQAYQIAQEGLGIKQFSAKTTAANDQAKNALGRQRNQITASNDAARNRITAQNDRANQALKAAGIAVTRQNDRANQALKAQANAIRATGTQKPLSAVSNNRATTQLGQIASAIQTWQQQGMKNKAGLVTEPHPTDGQMRQVLGTEFDPVLIQAAFELLGWGHITPQTAQLMHQSGMRNTSFDGKPIQVGQNPNNTNNASSAVSNTASGSNLNLP